MLNLLDFYFFQPWLKRKQFVRTFADWKKWMHDFHDVRSRLLLWIHVVFSSFSFSSSSSSSVPPLSFYLALVCTTSSKFDDMMYVVPKIRSCTIIIGHNVFNRQSCYWVYILHCTTMSWDWWRHTSWRWDWSECLMRIEVGAWEENFSFLPQTDWPKKPHQRDRKFS